MSATTTEARSYEEHEMRATANGSPPETIDETAVDMTED